jgi:opacity protein-like surface antigen
MKRALLALALAAALPLSAQAADGISYSYVEANYQSSDFLGENFDGFGIGGSFAFNEAWYGSVSYRKVGNNDFDVDLDETTVNLGWHTAMSDKADFLAEIGYVNVGVDTNSVFGSDSADGYRVAAGFRGTLAPNFEASIKARYTDLGSDNGGGDFGVGVGAVYHINPTWGITASYDHDNFDSEGMNTWGIGVRASFK